MTHKPKGRKVSNYDPFNIILGRKLGQIRKFLNLTQTDLGKCIDVSHQQYQKYETGYNKLSAAMLWKIKEFFNTYGVNIKCDDLLDKEQKVNLGIKENKCND